MSIAASRRERNSTTERTHQSGFGFPRQTFTSALRKGEIIVDMFAGGGGASEALRQATHRDPDLAINHSTDACGLHAQNHPFTKHLQEDIWQADPVKEVAGRPIGWMHASPDCFPAGTMVLTVTGYKPIEEISVGDMVLTHTSHWRAVSATMSTERELICLTGHGHPGLTVSPEHPFYARRRRDIWCTSPRGYRAEYDSADWVEASELDKGWYWATPHTFPKAPVPPIGGRGMEMSAALMWLAGRYIGDGWTRIDDKHAELVITCGKGEAQGLQWLTAKWPPRGKRAQCNELSWQQRHTGTAYQFTTAHQGFVTWLREHFGHGASEKKIPGWALGMCSELRAALLDGYCSADGHQTDAFIETQTVSKALAFGIKALAETQGHTVAIYTGTNRNLIEGRIVNARPIWRCRWRHEVDSTHKQTFRDELHEWAPVRKTEHAIGHGRVFNLSVDQDESYVVEGIVVHNCTHFSQAKGGQPRSRAVRSLSWVVLKWVGTLLRSGNAPRICSLENVKQVTTWGPLVAKRCKVTGRVMTLDIVVDPVTGQKSYRVAQPGEQVPVWNQALIPDKRREGQTWRRFIALLRGFGYAVEWRSIVASDFGAGTSRERLFLIARRDGDPICWPAPTHGKAPGLLPLVTAADSIDFSIPCPSVFLGKADARKRGIKRPLADKTLRRVAKGIKRYVIDAAEPFVVPLTHHGERNLHPAGSPLPTITGANRGELAAVGATLAPLLTEHANATNQRTMSIDEPLRTICAGVKGGHFSLVTPTLVQAAHGDGKPGGVNRWGVGAHDVRQPVGTIRGSGGSFALASAHVVKFRGNCQGVSCEVPLPTITSGAGAKRPAGAAHAMGCVTAFLEQANGGFYTGDGNDVRKPMPTICGTGSQQRLVTAHMAKLRGTSNAAAADAPLHTISAGGEHHAVVECTLAPEHEVAALRMAAFMLKYSGTYTPRARAALTRQDRLNLVTVIINGTPYVIVDVGLRMLRPREMFLAQGFPPDYVIDRTADGRKLSISASVKLVGNSVSPPPLVAIARANLDKATTPQQLAA